MLEPKATSYHFNWQLPVCNVLSPTWFKAVQQLGRVHRSNQLHPPKFTCIDARHYQRRLVTRDGRFPVVPRAEGH